MIRNNRFSLRNKLKNVLMKLQEFYILSFSGLFAVARKPVYASNYREQMEFVGADSFFIIVVLSLFIGMALSLQVGAEFSKLGLGMYTGRVLGISIISEIGPVITAVVFAGRCGTGIASELGSMVLRNQVDLIRVLGIDPIKKLIAPRIVGSVIMLPMLTVIGDAASLLGGLYIGLTVQHQSAHFFWSQVQSMMYAQYLIPGILKPFVFGFIVASIGCFTGISTKGGASGLRKATMHAFVYSIVTVIVADFLLTKMVLFILGYSV